MKICGIYKIVSPSGRIYIGQSIDIKRRIKSYKSANCIEQTFLYNSIKKYGWENHDFSIIIECERDELNFLEKKYIAEFNSFNSDIGLNLREGGDSSIMSDYTKLVMKMNRADFSNEKNPQFGKKWIYKDNECILVSVDQLESYLCNGWLLGNNFTKGNSNRKGVKITDDTRRKISENHAHHKPMLNKKHSDETIKKISESNKGKVAHNKKPIINIETGEIFPSKKEAADSIGMKVRTLKAKLLGQIKNNTNFRYLEDYNLK